MSLKPTKDKILLLRYSDFHGVNTIEEHIKVVKKKGACWWAKLGKTPSPKYISKYLENKSRIAFLYTAGSLHKCHVLDISDKRPEDSYPAYYDRDIFTNDEDVPSVFFKLSDIEEVDLSVLEDYLVVTSGKPALHDIKKTISSYFMVQHKDFWVEPVKKTRPVSNKPKTKPVSSTFCVYQKNGICENRRCISYRYECERPSSCMKQKLK